MTELPRHDCESTLSETPEYFTAVGAIAIEVTNLETVMGGLLEAFLGQPDDVGEIIYLTPQTAFGRLQIISNLVDYMLLSETRGAKELVVVLEKAKAIIGKRHALIHARWGTSDDGIVKSMDGPPRREGKEPQAREITELHDLVRRTRDLILEIRSINLKLRGHHAKMRLREVMRPYPEVTYRLGEPQTQTPNFPENNERPA